MQGVTSVDRESKGKALDAQGCTAKRSQVSVIRTTVANLLQH